MFQPHLLKNKLGQLLMRAGQRLLSSTLSSSVSSTIAAPIEPVEAALADDESLPPAHWLTLVGQQAPQWLEESEHPQMVRYRSTQKKSEKSKARPEGFHSIAKPQAEKLIAKKTKSKKGWAWFKAEPKLSEDKVSPRAHIERSSPVPSSQEKGSKASFEQGILSSNIDTVHYSDFSSEISRSADDNTSQNNFPGAEQSSTCKDYVPSSEQANQTLKHKLQSVDNRSSVEYQKSLGSKNRAFVRVKPYQGSSTVTPEASLHLSPSRSSIADSIVQEPHSSFAASESSENGDEPRSLTPNTAVLPEVESTKSPVWSRQFIATIKSAIARLQNEKQSKNEPMSHYSGAHSSLVQDQNNSRNDFKTVALETPTSNKIQKKGRNKQTEFSIPIQKVKQKTAQKLEATILPLASVQPLLKQDSIKQTVDAALWPELHQGENNASEAWPKLPSECKNPKVSEGLPTNFSETMMAQEDNGFEQRQALEQRGRLWSE
jgi:hypothetical protein